MDEPDGRQPPTRFSSPTRSSFLRPALLWVAALLPAFLLWVYVSPVGSSPDEPAHIAYAWGVASGQSVFEANACPIGERCILTEVEVPAGLVPNPRCHAFDRSVTATCQTPNQSAVATTYMTRYPPAFYFVVGLAMRLGDAFGLSANAVGLLGRVASVAIGLSLLAPALALAGRRAPQVGPAILLGLMPMTMFMTGSVNPNGVEICAGIAAAVAFAVLPARVSTSALLFAAYAVFWLAFTRPLGFLWAGALVAFGTAYRISASGTGQGGTGRRDLLRQQRKLVLVCGGITLLAFGWFVFTLGLRRTSGGESTTLPDNGIEKLMAIVLRWGGIVWENLGVLGWLDTPLPRALMSGLLVGVATMVVTYGGDVAGNRRQRLIVGGYIATIVVGVCLIMYRQAFLWQGRYAMAPIVIALVWWSAAATNSTRRATHRIAGIVWVLSLSGALWLGARYRYGVIHGARFDIPNLDRDPQWIGPLGTVGTVVLFTIAAAAVPLLLRSTCRAPSVVGSRSNDGRDRPRATEV